MADNRLSRKNIIATVNSGSGSARIDATIAEQKATEALAKIVQLQQTLASLGDTTTITNLTNKLNDEIKRAKKADEEQIDLLEEHAKLIEEILTSNPNEKPDFSITFLDNITEKELWEGEK
jgi:hypothetical protein